MSRHVRVIGAGMNGLLAAYYLQKKGCQVDVYELSSHVGGKIQTLSSQHGLMETAANAILADAEVESVAREVGVHLLPARREARKRWIYRQQKRRWPLGIMASLKVLKFVLFRKSLHCQPMSSESLENWGQRVLGKEATRYLLEPACLGIFGAPIGRLSARLIFEYFFNPRQRQKGVLSGSVAPKGGMGEFPQKLYEYLKNKGVQFYFEQKVIEESPHPTVIATDLISARDLLLSWRDPRAQLLGQIPMVDLTSVNIFFSQQRPDSDGFGVLFPRDQDITPLGVLLNHAIFEHRSSVRSETWIFGGVTPSEKARLSDVELLAEVQSARSKVFGVTEAALEFRVNRWPQGIPLYGIELEKALIELSIHHQGVYLLGNYLGEIGLNRFFHRAKSLAEELCAQSPKSAIP